MRRRGSIVVLVVLLLFAVSACAQPEPETVEVTREIEVAQMVEVTREVTRVVERVAKETVEVTCIEHVVVTATPTRTPRPTSAPRPTSTLTVTPTLGPTDTPTATITPVPTPVPATATVQSARPVPPGTHIVGGDIEPGIYIGLGGESILSACYWERLSDLSGELDAVIANDNAMGRFYVEVLETDRAIETACKLLPIGAVAAPAEPLSVIGPGTYIVGRDIEPGTYTAVAGDSIVNSCYWARLSCVDGTIDCVITNENAMGQFFVEVAASDFALKVCCRVQRVAE